MGPKDPSGKTARSTGTSTSTSVLLPQAGDLCKAQLQLAGPLYKQAGSNAPLRACVVPLDASVFIQMPVQNPKCFI